VNAGINGDWIANIRARLAEDVLALRPAAVVLYWVAAELADAIGRWLSRPAAVPAVLVEPPAPRPPPF
jgi:hypothetical protein